jgi:hypothetical protein
MEAPSGAVFCPVAIITAADQAQAGRQGTWGFAHTVILAGDRPFSRRDISGRMVESQHSTRWRLAHLPGGRFSAAPPGKRLLVAQEDALALSLSEAQQRAIAESRAAIAFADELRTVYFTFDISDGSPGSEKLRNGWTRWTRRTLADATQILVVGGLRSDGETVDSRQSLFPQNAKLFRKCAAAMIRAAEQFERADADP